MTRRKKIAFAFFYVMIILAILFTYLYIQDRYGKKPGGCTLKLIEPSCETVNKTARQHANSVYQYVSAI